MTIGGYVVTILDKNTANVGCATVSRCDAHALIEAMDEWKPKPTLKVGDFVKVLSSQSNIIPVGTPGKIVKIGNCIGYDLGVEFPQRIIGAHNLEGTTKEGHGYWFRAEELELID